jgi:YCII-related domain
MKYLPFCCMEEKTLDTISESEGDKIMKETLTYFEELRKSGQLLLPNPLEPVKMAIPVWVRNGRVSLTDGPFAETKGADRRVLSDRDPGHQSGYSDRLQVPISAPEKYGSSAGEGNARQGTEAKSCQDV